MKRLYLALSILGALCASAALPERALAVATTKVTLNHSTWTDLGVGPLLLNAGGTQVTYAISDVTPTIVSPQGFALLPPDKNETVNTASHVWAMAATTYAAYVYVSPVAGTSGSGGTFTWPGSATVTSYGVAPTGTVPAVNAYCTNCASTGGGVASWSPDRSYSTPLNVTNVSSSTPLPASAVVGSVIRVYNRGPNAAFWTLGAIPIATTSMALIAPQSWDYAVVKAGDTAVAAIVTLSTSSALLNIESGVGTPSGSGGPVNAAVAAPNITSNFLETIGGVDNAQHATFVGVTAAGTAAITGGGVFVQGNPSAVPIPVSGSFGVTVGGFTPSATGARMSPMTVLLSDTTGTLPNGPAAVISNADITNPVYCNVNGVAATVADQRIPPSSWFAFTVPVGQTALHCIATGGGAIVNGLGGSGLATGAGGGGGGSGGGSFTWPGTGGLGTGGATTAGTMPYVNAYVPGGVTANAGTNLNTSALATQTTAAATLAAIGTPMQQTGGSVTVNAGTNLNTSALATSINQTNGTQQTKLTDGTSILGTLANPVVTKDSGTPVTGTTLGTGGVGIIGWLSQFTQQMINGTDAANNAKTATAVNVTPIPCATTVATGGTSINMTNLGTATIHGFTIKNDDIVHPVNGEPIWINFTGTATNAPGNSFAIPPASTNTTLSGAGTYTTPPGFGSNTPVSVYAATTGHVISCVAW